MRRIILFAGLCLALPAGGAAAEDKKFPEFDKVVEGAKQYDGLFKLYQKDDKVYAEIGPSQLNTPYLCPIAVARGMGLAVPRSRLRYAMRRVVLVSHASPKTGWACGCRATVR